MSAPDIEFLDGPAGTASAMDVIDAEVVSPQGTPCEACGAPVEADDKFCPACGTPNPHMAHAAGAKLVPAQAVETPLAQFFRCETCGAEVATGPAQRSLTCPFCDSTYVVEFSPQATGRQPPEFVIGFTVTPEQALEKFQEWIRTNSWYHPGDLAMAKIADKLRGVYLPFWSFSMLAHSQWSADIGEHWYETRTYTTRDAKGNLVTRTERIQHTEWWNLAGRHHRYYSGYLISGSRGLSQKDAERIKPFQLPALRRYEPFYLAGWSCEEYSVDRGEALQMCQQEFMRQEKANITSFLPGDTHRGLVTKTNFSDVNSDLCLLPIYIFSYRYGDKLFRFLINGQTGKVAGDKPLSWPRIWIGVGVIAGGLLLLVLLILLLIGLIGAA
jgi:hypothetical protein